MKIFAILIFIIISICGSRSEICGSPHSTCGSKNDDFPQGSMEDFRHLDDYYEPPDFPPLGGNGI